MEKDRKVCIAFAVGCPRNQMDTAWLSSYFEANDWKITHNAAKADMLVVATCGFASHIEAESIRLLSLLEKKRRSDSRMVVVGCLAGINPDYVLSQFDATVIRPADIHQLDEVIHATVPLKNVTPVNCIEPRLMAARACWTTREANPTMSTLALIKRRTKATLCSLLSRISSERFALRTARRLCRRSKGASADPTYYIRVARGCLEDCTYCAIRFAAGVLRSKPLDDVLAEFDRGLAQKHRDFEILAEDVGSYGLDIGSNCIELFEGLFSRPGSHKFVITDVNVRYLIRFAPALSDLLARHADRIRRLKIPVQSGSDRILTRMKRCYTRTEAKAALSELRDKAPTLPTETHVLVGFPGETDQDFEDTLDLLRAARFDYIQAYRYTDRPGTAAAKMTDKIPVRIQRERIQRLCDEFPQARGSAIEDHEADHDGMPARNPERNPLSQPVYAFDTQARQNITTSGGLH